MHFGKRFADGQEAVVVRGRVNSRNRFGGLTGPQRFIGVMEAVFLERGRRVGGFRGVGEFGLPGARLQYGGRSADMVGGTGIEPVTPAV